MNLDGAGRLGLIILLISVMIWVDLVTGAEYEFPKNYWWFALAGAIFFVAGGEG